MTFLFDPVSAMDVLVELEKGWGGTPAERMATKYTRYAAQYGTSAPKVEGEEAVKAAEASAEKQSDTIAKDAAPRQPAQGSRPLACRSCRTALAQSGRKPRLQAPPPTLRRSLTPGPASCNSGARTHYSCSAGTTALAGDPAAERARTVRQCCPLFGGRRPHAALGAQPHRSFRGFPGHGAGNGTLPARMFKLAAYPLYGAVLVLLLLVELIGGIGGGSQRWLNHWLHDLAALRIDEAGDRAYPCAFLRFAATGDDGQLARPGSRNRADRPSRRAGADPARPRYGVGDHLSAASSSSSLPGCRFAGFWPLAPLPQSPRRWPFSHFFMTISAAA